MLKFLGGTFCILLVSAGSNADVYAWQDTRDGVTFSCLFRSAPTDCGFREQSKRAGRASLVNVAGMHGVRLQTRPGDSSVRGSRDAERTDLALSQQASDCHQGREHWWAHSILFPDDYVAPPESTESTWNWGVVVNFHNSAPGPGQANFQVMAMPVTAISPDRPTGLSFQMAWGDQVSPSTYNATIGPVVKNEWYNFVYHVRWSSQSDGFFDAWVNGMKTMTYRGPTLYPEQGCYFKLANYHSAFGKPTSVIHARVIRGLTARAVSLGPLEGHRP
ncbi:MAG: heparin lyase I family protein [Gammaproteobacteria bacterium]|nr:heparin lyase I family protein [Gammaproteobacteria bacterium]